jgi:hypothetical protein
MLCKFETDRPASAEYKGPCRRQQRHFLRYCCSTISYSPVWTRKNEIPNRTRLLLNTYQPLQVIPDRCISFVFFGYCLRLQHEGAYIACCCSWHYPYRCAVLFITIIIIITVKSQQFSGIQKSTRVPLIHSFATIQHVLSTAAFCIRIYRRQTKQFQNAT